VPHRRFERRNKCAQEDTLPPSHPVRRRCLLPVPGFYSLILWSSLLCPSLFSSHLLCLSCRRTSVFSTTQVSCHTAFALCLCWTGSFVVFSSAHLGCLHIFYYLNTHAYSPLLLLPAPAPDLLLLIFSLSCLSTTYLLPCLYTPSALSVHLLLYYLPLTSLSSPFTVCAGEHNKTRCYVVNGDARRRTAGDAEGAGRTLRTRTAHLARCGGVAGEPA